MLEKDSDFMGVSGIGVCMIIFQKNKLPKIVRLLVVPSPEQ